MRKIIHLCAVLLTVFVTHSMAQQKGSSVLYIELDGDMNSFCLLDKPVITFDGKMLNITSTLTSVSYERSKVKRFFFEDVETSITNLHEDEFRFVRSSNDEMQVYGLGEDEKSISVYDAGGRRIPVEVNAGDNTASISLRACPRGIYIIKIGNKQSIKITKK